MTFQRILNFPSVLNFRDFGNYGTTSGARMKPRRLFRSAHLSDVSDADLAEIEAFGIELIVDLRYKPERDRQPNRVPEIQSPRILEFPDAPDTLGAGIAPHEMFIREDLREPQDARDYMNRSYRSRAHDPAFKQIFGDTLRFMASTGAPILIHCAAGKDRTGTLAAIIHGALGADIDTIMSDYMLTMKAVDIDAFLEPAATKMSEKYGRPYDPESLRPMFGVEPDYLENSLKAIGDMERYIIDDLDLSIQELTAIRDKYL